MILECKQCGEPFEFWDEGTKGWVGRQAEDISCPHCGFVNGQQVTMGYVATRKLTAEQRAEHERSKRGES